MIDRAIGGLVPLVQDDLSINRAVVSLERCGPDCTSFILYSIRKAESHINDFLYLSTYNVLYYE